MINTKKLIAFAVITLLLLCNIYVYGMKDNWIGIGYLLLMYITFILVALYDIGKDEPDTN